MTDFNYSTATVLMARLRASEVTSTQLLEQHIARVAQCDGPINAVMVHTFEVTRERAVQADAARTRGEDWGPLHGLPMTVKEIFRTARHTHLLGISKVQGRHRAAARRGGAAPAGRRCRGLWQDQCACGTDRLAVIQSGLWHHEQPLGPEPHAGRLNGWRANHRQHLFRPDVPRHGSLARNRVVRLCAATAPGVNF